VQGAFHNLFTTPSVFYWKAAVEKGKLSLFKRCLSMSDTAPYFATRAVHVGVTPDPTTGAVVMPIYQTNGFAFDDLDQGADIFALRRTGFSYSRGSNPTVAALEKRIASLEGGVAGIACASGQSALLMILLTLCKTGDSYVGANRLFGGSLGLMERLNKRCGIRVEWADPLDPPAIEAAITETTRAIVVESVINPSGEVVDLPTIAAIAKQHKLPLVVDNTLPTPALFRPIEHGADIVFHSASKFLCGHGTTIGGLIIDAGTFPWQEHPVYDAITAPWQEYDDLVLTNAFPAMPFTVACRLIGLRELGPGLAPFNAFFLLTGIETLPLRMEHHAQTAEKVALFLAEHHAVEHVSHPCVPQHPNFDLAKKLCPMGSGAIFTITLKGGEAAVRQALPRFKIVSHLVNIGESHTLVAHPASTTHRTLTKEHRAMLGITDGTLRLSIGLEAADDIITDFTQALA
jgi:O-acetylhomoserine (thiol)-lyase